MKAQLLLKKKKGSSSIMVMLIMLVLVVFGVLALMSSYSDFKLSKKSAAWNTAYYNLDAKGEEFLSKVDANLNQAAKESDSQGIFMNKAEANLAKLTDNYNLKLKMSGDKITVNAVIKDEAENKLGIVLETAAYKDYLMNSTKSEYAKLYSVIEWKQLPKEFEFNDEINFGDIEVINP